VLAPAAFLLVAVGALADRGRARPGQLQGALVSAGACFAGLVNPVGPVSFLLPVRFRQAAGPAIAEWAPTAFTMILTVTWGLLIAVLVVAWARTPGSISATELLWVFCWTVFGLSAIRNVGPATLFVAPVVVRALERAAGGRLGRLSRGPGRREGRVLVALAVAVTVVGVAVVATSVSRVDPLERAPALAIARRLAAAPGPLRIWNAYNASGVLIAFGGGRTGHLRLVVDGRADLWGGAYIDRVGGVAELHDGWRAEFFGFRPDAAVLPVDAPLVDQLVHGDDWQVALHVPGDDYVLVVPPRSRLA
jgi:hypothetical protein